MDFFDYQSQEYREKNAPLANRMRPRTLDDFAGQSHILAPGRLLRRAIQADQLSSLIFYGPPGTGKTTLARIIANTTKAQFLSLNAVLAGVKDIRSSIDSAQDFQKHYQKKTILFIDEVHRFNKAQQDALLPHVENGTVTLIGATTENPYFEVNKALVSRSRIFQLRSLKKEDLIDILQRALKNEEYGFGKQKIKIEEEARNHLVNVANGDARAVLNAFELAVETSPPDEKGVILITLLVAEESIQRRAVLYDKDGDAHFDTISAFIKAIRGSDPDAALYWMAKMIYAGEDPRYLFRRMLILAAEDIGMADPNALRVVMSASQAFDYVGMPEGRFHLAEACLYISTTKKSNSSFAFFDALSAVEKEKEAEPPNHLKDGNRDKEGFGHGEGYLYPHAYQDHWIAQQYLPEELQGRLFYQPSDQGYEKAIQEEVFRKREAQLAAMLENQESDAGQSWEERTLGNSGELLETIRDLLFSLIPSISRETMALNLNAGSGLFLGEVLRQAAEGTVYGVVKTGKEEKRVSGQFRYQNPLSQPVFLRDDDPTLTETFKGFQKEKIKFDLIVGRNVILHVPNKEEFFLQLNETLQKQGVLGLAENLPAAGQRISSFLPERGLSWKLRERIRKIEEKIYQEKENPMVNWGQDSILEICKKCGLKVIQSKLQEFYTPVLLTEKKIESWFEKRSEDSQKSYGEHLAVDLSPKEIDHTRQQFLRENAGKVRSWLTTVFLIVAKKETDFGGKSKEV